MPHHSALKVKKIVRDPETGEDIEIIENIGKVCADAWNCLDDDIKSQWATKAKDLQIEFFRSQEGSSYLMALFVTELKAIAEVQVYLLIAYQEAEKNNIAFFGIVHQSPKPEDPNLKPELIYNKFSAGYVNGFIADGLLTKFCELVLPAEAYIAEDNVKELLKFMKKRKEPTLYNNFMRIEANGKLTFNCRCLKRCDCHSRTT